MSDSLDELSIEVTESQATLDPSQEPTFASVHAELNTLAQSMKHFDETVSSTQDLRRALANKMMPAVMAMDLDDTSDPDVTLGKSKFLAEYRQLLNDMDGSAKTHIGIKLKQKDMEDQHANSINAAELLAAVKLNNDILTQRVNQTNPEELSKLVEDRLVGTDETILDSELQLGGNSLPPVVNESDENKRIE